MKIVLRLLSLVMMAALMVTMLRLQAHAAPATKLGVHILEPEEIFTASQLLPNGGYVTVVIRSDQLQPERWQAFFDRAGEKITPIIRLATTVNGATWERPTRRDIVSFAQFLSSLDWHRDELIVVAFNEPNHAKEWGGVISPEDYGQTLSFLSQWFNTEPRKYIVLPAALDAASGNTSGTMRADQYLSALVSEYPDTIRGLGGWNSHAYPNPHFSGLPTDSHRMSIKSYQFEQKYIQEKLGVSLPVYITETGWDGSKKKDTTIAAYFKDAFNRVWNPDEAVVSVTPFLLNAQMGPFVSFSLLNQQSKPTALFDMIKKLSST